MRRRLMFAAAAAGLVVVGGVTVGAGMASASGPETPATKDIEQLHDEQSRAPQAQDKLPAVFLDADHASDFQVETARYLSTSANASYWSVLSTNGDLCLVVEPVGGDMVGASCSPPEIFAKHGITFAVHDLNPENSFGVHLVPDLVSSARSPLGADRIAPNLIEVSVQGGDVPAEKIAADGFSVELREIPEPPK